MKDQADKLRLKTAIRTLSSGRLKEGTPFSFGHIYQILTNPIYAGRIRHKANLTPVSIRRLFIQSIGMRCRTS
jgi:site-specific DNA recombinase